MHSMHRHAPIVRRAAARGIALVPTIVSFAVAAVLVAIAGALVVDRAGDPDDLVVLAARRPSPAAVAPHDDASRADAPGVIDFRGDAVDDWSSRWRTTWRATPPSAPASVLSGPDAVSSETPAAGPTCPADPDEPA